LTQISKNDIIFMWKGSAYVIFVNT